MSNSNYSIGLQGLKPVHTAYCGLRNLAENWSWARDVNGRDRDETETSASRDRDDDNFSRDETETRRWYVSRPSRDRDVEAETTTVILTTFFPVFGCHLQSDNLLSRHWPERSSQWSPLPALSGVTLHLYQHIRPFTTNGPFIPLIPAPPPPCTVVGGLCRLCSCFVITLVSRNKRLRTTDCIRRHAGQDGPKNCTFFIDSETYNVYTIFLSL